MRKLIEMMKEKSFFSGSNAEFLEIFNAYAGTEFKSNALKRMMNQWKPELEKNGVSLAQESSVMAQQSGWKTSKTLV